MYYVRYLEEKNTIRIFRYQRHHVGYHKKNGFMFGGVRCPLGEGALRELADDVLIRLENQSPYKVDRWIKRQIKGASKRFRKVY